jgi:hypothetical protein
MERVYLETTIPSLYFETRHTPRLIAWRKSTRLWWSSVRSRYALRTSAFVIDELARTPGDKAGLCLGLLSQVELLPQPVRLESTIEYYIKQKLMPQDALGDAAHLAICSLHGIEYLLTWNCQHLANASKFRHLRVLNERLGLPTPIIVTPELLMPADESRP